MTFLKKMKYEFDKYIRCELKIIKMEYSFNDLKKLFESYGYFFYYEIIPKSNTCWATQTRLDYFNIIVEIKDKCENLVFFTDENVFTIKNGEEMICKKCINICIGDYNIFGKDFSFECSEINELENDLQRQLQIM